MVALDGYGLEIVGRVPLEMPVQSCNEKYLRTKRQKLGHLLRDEPELSYARGRTIALWPRSLSRSESAQVRTAGSRQHRFGNR